MGTVCSVCVRVNAGFIASDWAWLHEPMLGHWNTVGRCDRGDRTTRQKLTMVQSGRGCDNVLLPAHIGNEVSSRVGGVAEWP